MKNNECFYAFVLGVFIGGILGFAIASRADKKWREKYVENAVKLGKAEYYLDGKNVEWRWKP